MTNDNVPRLPQTKTARFARSRVHRTLAGFGDDTALYRKVQAHAPAAWATLEEDIDCDEPRVKLTLRVDASVAKFYRAMGVGYQARMNRILATYAQMQIGAVYRERDEEEEVNAILRDRLPAEVGDVWRKHRHLLEDSDNVDVARWDRLFGV